MMNPVDDSFLLLVSAASILALLGSFIRVHVSVYPNVNADVDVEMEPSAVARVRIPIFGFYLCFRLQQQHHPWSWQNMLLVAFSLAVAPLCAQLLWTIRQSTESWIWIIIGHEADRQTSQQDRVGVSIWRLLLCCTLSLVLCAIYNYRTAKARAASASTSWTSSCLSLVLFWMLLLVPCVALNLSAQEFRIFVLIQTFLFTCIDTTPTQLQHASVSSIDWSPLYDRTYVLNLVTRPDRLASCRAEFERVGFDWSRLRVFTAQRHPNGSRDGCRDSHKRIIQDAAARGLDHVYIFEDDVVFHIDTDTESTSIATSARPGAVNNSIMSIGQFASLLRTSASFISSRDDWDIFYLGCWPVFTSHSPIPNIAHVKATAAHAYVVNLKPASTTTANPAAAKASHLMRQSVHDSSSGKQPGPTSRVHLPVIPGNYKYAGLSSVLDVIDRSEEYGHHVDNGFMLSSLRCFAIYPQLVAQDDEVTSDNTWSLPSEVFRVYIAPWHESMPYYEHFHAQLCRFTGHRWRRNVAFPCVAVTVGAVVKAVRHIKDHINLAHRLHSRSAPQYKRKPKPKATLASALPYASN